MACFWDACFHGRAEYEHDVWRTRTHTYTTSCTDSALHTRTGTTSTLNIERSTPDLAHTPWTGLPCPALPHVAQVDLKLGGEMLRSAAEPIQETRPHLGLHSIRWAQGGTFLGG